MESTAGTTLEVVDWLSRKRINRKWHIEELSGKRSLLANRYYFQLIEKIAKAKTQITGVVHTKDDIHRFLIEKYGAWEMNEDGTPKTCVLFEGQSKPDGYFYDTNTVVEVKHPNGENKIGRIYISVKGSRIYSPAEMKELIDGTIIEAKEFDIETRTPAEIEVMIRELEEYERKHNDK